jgi:N-methylhydantoinase A
MRYAGQGFEVTTEFPLAALESADAEALRTAFGQAYARQFGRMVQGMPVEAVNWRLAASLPGHDFSLERRATKSHGPRRTRAIHFADAGTVEAVVVDRYSLQPGDRVEGPAIFEERESSFAMGPGSSARVDSQCNLVVTIGYP